MSPTFKMEENRQQPLVHLEYNHPKMPFKGIGMCWSI